MSAAAPSLRLPGTSASPLIAAGVVAGVAVPLVLALRFSGTAALALMVALCVAAALRPGADLFAPATLFTGVWTLCAAIGSIIVSVQQSPWNATTWACVVLAPVAFWTGDVCGRLLSGSAGEALPDLPRRIAPWPLGPAVVAGAAWWLAAFALSVYEFRTLTGGIPLFSTDWERVRMAGSEGYIGRVIHAIAYSGILLAIVTQVALLSQPRLLCARTVPLIVLWLAALGLAALWGSRHTLFYPAAAAVVSFHCTRHRLGPLRIAVLAAAGFAFLAAVQLLRQSAAWSSQEDVTWLDVLRDIGYAGWPPILAQVHQTVAINFEIFRQLTETIPGLAPYHLGAFTFHWLHSLLPGTQPTLAQWQNEFWATGFHGSLTSTHMGPLYADFGIAGVVLWTAAFAAVMRCLYVSLRRAPTPAKVVWFSFLTTQMIVMPYDNTLVKLATVLSLLILWAGITAMGGRRAEPPPPLTERPGSA